MQYMQITQETLTNVLKDSNISDSVISNILEEISELENTENASISKFKLKGTTVSILDRVGIRTIGDLKTFVKEHGQKALLELKKGKFALGQCEYEDLKRNFNWLEE